tara:strand:- start:905 stop:1201 length:297 start_codon:yes stop_codon:yes gene_type:complete
MKHNIINGVYPVGSWQKEVLIASINDIRHGTSKNLRHRQLSQFSFQDIANAKTLRWPGFIRRKGYHRKAKNFATCAQFNRNVLNTPSNTTFITGCGAV